MLITPLEKPMSSLQYPKNTPTEKGTDGVVDLEKCEGYYIMYICKNDPPVDAFVDVFFDQKIAELDEKTESQLESQFVIPKKGKLKWIDCGLLSKDELKYRPFSKK